MTQRIQHRRYTDNAAGWPASAIMAGEMVVNPLRRELGIGDTDGTVRMFTGVRVFDERSQYIVGDMVVTGGRIYRCKTSIGTPHPFNAAEWDDVSMTPAEMFATFDARYALIGHNHDAAYSPLSHNHDAVYAPLSHTHSQYALTSHTHTGVYARLTGDTFTGAVNFNNIVNMQGSYAAVYGSLSIAAGSGGFVGSYPLHVRASGLTAMQLQSTSAQQVRYLMKNSNREMMLYIDSAGTFAAIYDNTAAREIMRFPVSSTAYIEAQQKMDVAGELLVHGDITSDTKINSETGFYENGVKLPTTQYAKAWVRFASNGAISADAGVSTVVRNSAGNFTITFSPALPSANYAVSVAPHGTDTLMRWVSVVSQTTTTLVIQFLSETGAPNDAGASVVVFN